uniref:Fibronectin type-III domain-containing protein n=1 Tax=Amphimedon queenslandica TaxID=400682 RepID=A0A1X7UIR9_AMPQE
MRHNGNCYPNGSYFWDDSIRPTPLECGLPGATLNGGQWIGPNGVVLCPGSNSNLFCTIGSGASLSVHIPTTNTDFLGAPGDGWYKCCLPTNCSDPNTNIIFANIFRYAQIESFNVADLPSDMTVYPQKYKLNCTKIGHWRYSISIGSSTALASYTYCDDRYSICPGTVLDSNTNRIRYTATITWDGMTVSSGSVSQSTTGDQMYQCLVAVTDQPTRIRNMTIKAPAIAPSSLNVVNKTATTITVSWTALDSYDADGYVVNVTSDTDTVRTVQVEGSSNNTIITLDELSEGISYNITVRAYQQLLGPASTISVQTLSEYLSGPVGSVSSIMDTTWAVISWSVPSYIPSDYPIITYEIGYHILFDRLCCSIVNDNDIDIQMLQLYNSTSGMLGAVDDTSIGLVAVVGLLLISLVISIIVHIYRLIKLKSYHATTSKQTNKFDDDDIPMQACEPYSIQNITEAADEEPGVNAYADDAIYET